MRFDQYYLAEQTGWVLYLEGTSDLKILQAFATRLGHPVQNQLTKPFVHYIGNHPNKGRERFDALVEAKEDLVGILIIDRIDKKLEQQPALVEYMWTKREVENYLCHPETLINYARSLIRGEGQLLEPVISSEAEEVMRRTIAGFVAPAYLENQDHSW